LIKRLVVVFLSGVVFAQSSPAAPSREYFRYTREVTIGQSGKQNYLIVDPAIWAHARPDLADIRLYEGDAQVPYALSEEQGASSTLEREARILNLGVRGGRTEFDLDIGSEAEYNHVELRLKTTNFVASGTVEGRETLNQGSGRKLSTTTLYDFSREALGNNLALRLPPATFRYLHVTIAPAINPREISGASTSVQREAQATWMSAGRCWSPEQVKRTTRIACDLDLGVPVARILFTVPADLVNFRRTVRVTDPQGAQLCSGSISRIRMKSGGKEVVTEDLALVFCANKEHRVLVEIDNGDNTPLTVDKVEPQSLERRIYVDPAGKTVVRLYYGDEKLTAPEYDYARFFHKEADAALVVAAAERQNPDYTGRPDERPWSERHQWVLWGAMLVAMALLAVLALKGLVSGASAEK
jgi:hypothetical protein